MCLARRQRRGAGGGGDQLQERLAALTAGRGQAGHHFPNAGTCLGQVPQICDQPPGHRQPPAGSTPGRPPLQVLAGVLCAGFERQLRHSRPDPTYERPLRADIVFPVLTKQLNSLDSDTRVSVAAWGRELETHRPLPHSLLLTPLTDPNDDVRTSGTNSLENITAEILTNTVAQ